MPDFAAPYGFFKKTEDLLSPDLLRVWQSHPHRSKKRPCTTHLLDASPRESIPSSWQDSYTKSSPSQENLWASHTQQLIASTASKTNVLQGHGGDVGLPARKKLSHFCSLIPLRSV